MSELEDQFAKLEQAVKDKLEQASRLIGEATELVAQSGLKAESWSEPDQNDEVPLSMYHYELYDATKPLMNAIENAGWSASSLRC